MIRKFKPDDLPSIMGIWLNTNIHSHAFISKKYWLDNYEPVKKLLPDKEIYVYESEREIGAFVGIDHGHIAGLFVTDKMQSKGIGKQLLEKCKGLYSELTLCVYKKNPRAIAFYKNEGFIIEKSQTDEKTGELEYFMVWKK